jgi:hypothetical protein
MSGDHSPPTKNKHLDDVTSDSRDPIAKRFQLVTCHLSLITKFMTDILSKAIVLVPVTALLRNTHGVAAWKLFLNE